MCNGCVFKNMSLSHFSTITRGLCLANECVNGAPNLTIGCTSGIGDPCNLCRFQDICPLAASLSLLRLPYYLAAFTCCNQILFPSKEGPINQSTFDWVSVYLMGAEPSAPSSSVASFSILFLFSPSILIHLTLLISFFWSGLQGPKAFSLWYGVVPKPSVG